MEEIQKFPARENASLDAHKVFWLTHLEKPS